MSTYRVIIAGAGLAGISAAERLREAGFTGEVLIVGDEPHQPYNRTPLSKGLLAGSRPIGDLPIRAYTELQASWRLGTPIRGVQLQRRVLSLDDGTELQFDGLVIATGAHAQGIPDAPMHSPHVWPLRTLEDAHHIDRGMARAKRVAIVGGGYIGTEIASTARERGLPVTLVDRSPTVLHRSLGAAIGAIVGDIHRNAGVRLHLGVSVRDWEEHAHGVTLHLDDGEAVDAGVAIVGVGTRPATDWLQGNGLDLTDGILTDANCFVLGQDGRPLQSIVAAGDITRWPNLRLDATPRRVEHWINAIEMGRAAADSLLAGRSRAVPFSPIPRFWSHQHGVRIQSSGIPALGTHMTVLDGAVDRRRFLAGFTRPTTDGPQLVGTVALDAPRAALARHPSIGQVLGVKAA